MKAFLCYGCQITSIDERTFQYKNDLRSIDFGKSNLAFLTSEVIPTTAVKLGIDGSPVQPSQLVHLDM